MLLVQFSHEGALRVVAVLGQGAGLQHVPDGGVRPQPGRARQPHPCRQETRGHGQSPCCLLQRTGLGTGDVFCPTENNLKEIFCFENNPPLVFMSNLENEGVGFFFKVAYVASRVNHIDFDLNQGHRS